MRTVCPPQVAAFCAAFIACLFSQAEAASVALDLLKRFNVMVGDYNAGSETEGAAFVYGRYKGTGRFGFNGGTAAHDSEYMLWLNNGVTSSQVTQMQSGSVLSRVAVNPSLFQLNGNAPGTPGITTGESAWSAAIQNELGLNSALEVATTMRNASIHWTEFAANSSVSLPGNGGLSFNATPQDINGHQVAIFNVTSDQLAGFGFDRFDLTLNGAESVLINVSGKSITINKNFAGAFNGNESIVLFNFYEADKVTLNTNFRGGVLAPIAVVNQKGSNIDGSVVAATFNQTAEVHAYNFNGYLPLPEPSSAMLSFLGTGLILRRRR